MKLRQARKLASYRALASARRPRPDALRSATYRLWRSWWRHGNLHDYYGALRLAAAMRTATAG